MKHLRISIFILLLFYQFSCLAQQPQFQSFPDFNISIDPSIPIICYGTPIRVTCNEDFVNYKWKGVGFDFQAKGKNVELTEIGQYTLTIKGKLDGKYYYKILNFYSETDDPDNDGLCGDEDCMPDNPFIGKGFICDDLNPCTTDDAFDISCNCVGIQVSDCNYSPHFDEDQNYSNVVKSLSNTYYTSIQKDQDAATDIESVIKDLSSIPFAQKLVEDDMKIEISSLQSSEIIQLFSDIIQSQYTPGYLGHDLKSISPSAIKSWRGLAQTPIIFRTKTSILDSVSIYMDDFQKESSSISFEITNCKNGYNWWYNYVLKRKYWTSFLEDIDNIKAFAKEILAFNEQTEGGGKILSGSPSSAINTALYYDDVLEQGASIFKTIIKNHMFYDGNKRTATETIISFMNKAGIPINKSQKKIFKLAKKVAKDEVVEVSEIAFKLIK